MKKVKNKTWSEKGQLKEKHWKRQVKREGTLPFSVVNLMVACHLQYLKTCTHRHTDTHLMICSICAGNICCIVANSVASISPKFQLNSLSRPLQLEMARLGYSN